MPYLNSVDYEKVLKFYSYINKDYDHFISNVLFAMGEYFDFRLCVYTVFNKNSKDEVYVESIYSNSLHPEILQNYQNKYYKTDMFYQKLSYMKSAGNALKYSYTISDVADLEEFYATPYGQSMIQSNLSYQAAMRDTYAKRFPHHVLNVFKSSQEGDFTRYEKKLLECLGKVFVESVNLYTLHQESTKFVNFLTYQTESQNTGMLIVDDKRTVVYYNSLFLRVMSGILDTEGVFSTATALLSRIDDYLGYPVNRITERIQMKAGGQKVQADVYRMLNGETMQKFVMITTQKETQSTEPLNQRFQSFSEEYNLTLREIEIATLLAQGLDNNQMAEDLCINVSTVKFHIKNIFRKLGVTNRSAAIAKMLK